MKAKRVYEFERSTGLKSNLNVGIKKQIEQWFETWAPDVDYTIKENAQVIVHHNFTLFNNKYVTKLPPNLVYVNGTLDLFGSMINELPPNLYITENLDLEGSQVSKLPSGLTVGRNLYANNTKITELPEDLTVGKQIFYLNKKPQ